MQTKETVVPFFPGFYESELSWMIDREEEYYLEENDKTWEEIQDEVDYHRGYLAISQAWLDAFCDEVGISLKYKEVDSPREYNFTTDRLVAEIEMGELERIRKIVDSDWETLSRVIKENFTSRSGFVSFYSNDIDEWMEKDTDDLDHNEIMTYIQAYVEINHEPRELLDYIHDRSPVYEAAQQIWV